MQWEPFMQLVMEIFIWLNIKENTYTAIKFDCKVSEKDIAFLDTEI